MSEKNTLEIEMDFLDADIEVEDQSYGSNFPVIQWVNGKVTAKAAGEDKIAYTGGWFLSAEQGIEAPPGFTPYTLVTNEGVEVPGFACKDLTFSPIRTRRCWTVPSVIPGGRSKRFAQSNYDDAVLEGKVRGTTHIIAGLKGLDEPVLISVRGMLSKAMMGQGNDRGIIPQYGSKIIHAAKRLAREASRKGANGKAKEFPLCSFMLTVGPERDAKGVPTYTKVGQGKDTSMITMPVWLDEPKAVVVKKDLNRIYVGAELMGLYQDIHRECDEWAEAWSAESLSRRDGVKPGVPSSEEGLPGDQSIPF